MLVRLSDVVNGGARGRSPRLVGSLGAKPLLREKCGRYGKLR